MDRVPYGTMFRSDLKNLVYLEKNFAFLDNFCLYHTAAIRVRTVRL